MICPFMVNISLLVGSIISWGIMWPLIEQKKGIWYSANLSASSLHGIQGYRVCHQTSSAAASLLNFQYFIAFPLFHYICSDVLN